MSGNVMVGQPPPPIVIEYDFGALLHEAWQAKRSVSDSISSPEIDQTYEAARAEGALGGKITGAGGGGFLLLFVAPRCQAAVREKLHHLLHVPFRFENAGSQVIFFDRDEDYSALEADHKIRNLAAPSLERSKQHRNDSWR